MPSMLDPKTLILVVIVLGMLLGLCMLGLRRTLPASIQGLYPWSFALFGFSLAALLAFLARQQQIALHWLPFAGAIYVGSALLLAVSMRRFCGRPTPWRPLLWTYVLLVSPAWVSLLLPLPLGWAQLWLTSVMLGCALTGLDALRREPQVRASLGGRLLLFAVVGMVLSTLLRMGLVLQGEFRAGWLADQNGLRAQLAMVFASGVLLVGSIGLMLLGTDRLRRMLEHLASHDALTGLLERNGFRAPAEHSLALARRREEPVACLLCDIDHFKRVNDLHGHPAGDAGLVLIADVLRESVRASDLVARFGGEEFALLLPNCEEAAATRFAERLRAAVESRPLQYRDRTISLTLSIGIAVGRGEQLQLEPMYRRADRALYAAKHGGRNRVRMAPAEMNNVAPSAPLKTEPSTHPG